MIECYNKLDIILYLGTCTHAHENKEYIVEVLSTAFDFHARSILGGGGAAPYPLNVFSQQFT